MAQEKSLESDSHPFLPTILTILSEGRNYGMGIARRMTEMGQSPGTFPNAALYHELRHMTQIGLISTSPGKPIAQQGGTPRTYYELTPAGVTMASLSRPSQAA